MLGCGRAYGVSVGEGEERCGERYEGVGEGKGRCGGVKKCGRVYGVSVLGCGGGEKRVP